MITTSSSDRNCKAANRSSCRSPTTMCANTTPRSRSRSASHGPLASRMIPDSTSVPVTSMPARTVSCRAVRAPLIRQQARLAPRPQVVADRARALRHPVGAAVHAHADRVVAEVGEEPLAPQGPRHGARAERLLARSPGARPRRPRRRRPAPWRRAAAARAAAGAGAAAPAAAPGRRRPTRRPRPECPGRGAGAIGRRRLLVLAQRPRPQQPQSGQEQHDAAADHQHRPHRREPAAAPPRPPAPPRGRERRGPRVDSRSYRWRYSSTSIRESSSRYSAHVRRNVLTKGPGRRFHSSFSRARRYLPRILVAVSTSVMSIRRRIRASRSVSPISGMSRRGHQALRRPERGSRCSSAASTRAGRRPP